MYLQLADNDPSQNYDTIRTNQGDLFIRKDLSAGGKGAKILSKASGALGKIAPFVPLPGAAIVGKALTQVSGISGKVAGNLTGLPPIPKGTLLSKLKGNKIAISTPTATTPMTITTATMPTDIDVTGEQKPSFFKKYKLPILIGGGVLLLGGAYLLLKKKKR